MKPVDCCLVRTAQEILEIDVQLVVGAALLIKVREELSKPLFIGRGVNQILHRTLVNTGFETVGLSNSHEKFEVVNSKFIVADLFELLLLVNCFGLQYSLNRLNKVVTGLAKVWHKMRRSQVC